jgi:hypothetical protein
MARKMYNKVNKLWNKHGMNANKITKIFCLRVLWDFYAFNYDTVENLTYN